MRYLLIVIQTGDLTALPVYFIILKLVLIVYVHFAQINVNLLLISLILIIN